MQATIIKLGNSQGVRLPKNLLKSVNLATDDKVDISAEGDMLIIRKIKPVKKHKSIKELFEGYTGNIGDYEPEKIDWGKPIGNEIW